MVYRRFCDLPKNHSFFLFGMRGVGKSTLLKKKIDKKNKDVLWIDLLLAEDEMKYRRNPDILIEEVEAIIKQKKKLKWIVIDEVQKIPKLLDIVHYLIEKYKIRFALSGSSARKLKRGGANLLAGRAFVFSLFPLTWEELGKDFNLDNYLLWGGLPALYGKDYQKKKDKERFLKGYINTYMKEEILIEQIIRKIDPFTYFLEVAGQMNGEILNFSKIGRDAGIDDKSAERYYSILEDTLLGFHLVPFHQSIRKRQISSSKFYFFDMGIVHALRGHFHLSPSSYEYGKIFENFVINQIYIKNRYLEKDYRLSYLKTKDGVEIDLIVEVPPRKRICVEIKSGIVNSGVDYLSKKKISDDMPNSELIIISQNKRALKSRNGVSIFPWKQGINYIFSC